MWIVELGVFLVGEDYVEIVIVECVFGVGGE